MTAWLDRAGGLLIRKLFTENVLNLPFLRVPARPIGDEK